MAEVKAYSGTAKEMARQNRQLSDSVMRDIGSLKRLVAALQVGTTTQRTIYTAGRDTIIYLRDSTPVVAKSYRFEDRYLSASALIHLDSMQLKVAVRESFRYTLYEKRNGLFGPTELRLKAVPLSPYTVVDTATSFVVTPPRKRWYQTTGFKVGVGVVAGQLIRTAVLR